MSPARDSGPTASPTLASVRLPISAGLEGVLVRRYKRFLADVELADGRFLTVHCPNPGSMRGTDAPGSKVRCSSSDDPKRKLRHTLEMIRVGRIWVGLHAARANALVRRALEAAADPAFAGYARLEAERPVPEGSRFDFRLGGHPDRAGPLWLEVKSVTLCAHRAARFPDAVTLRGRRHLEHLAARRRDGERAALLYVVQRGDAESVAPADDIDPEYGATLRRVVEDGVEVHAWRVRVGARGLRLERRLPVKLA